MQTQSYTVEGMTCSHCEQAIVSQIMEQCVVEQVQADAATGIVHVHGLAQVSDQDILDAITEAGYSARVQN